MTEPPPLQQCDQTYVRFRGRKLSYFSGCDYFRLAGHPKVIAALKDGLQKYGLNVAASRLTSGNHILYQQLERRLANFFDAPRAVVVSNGYITNLVVAQALAGNFSHVLIDEAAHPSLSDAARFFDCPVLRFKHGDVKDLASSVRRCGPGAGLIVLTDGMFSLDGSVAPLPEYRRVLPRDAWILVDDAHGAGVLGRTGKGSLEYTGVPRQRIIQTITLSKAFGAFGGAILGSVELRQKILDRSQQFLGSTPLPLPLVSAALESIGLLRRDRGFKTRLTANTEYVRNRLRDSSRMVAATPGPILKILPESPKQSAALSRRLLRARIYPSFMRYPGAPATGCFRFVISSEHSRKQLEALIEVLAA